MRVKRVGDVMSFCKKITASRNVLADRAGKGMTSSSAVKLEVDSKIVFKSGIRRAKASGM